MSFIDTSEQKDKIEVRKQMNQMISEAKKKCKANKMYFVWKYTD